MTRPVPGPRRAARRRLLALALGVALPTVLLALGWLLASLREQAALAREHQTAHRQAAERITAAVREGLEELRRREDARPFYLYNHFYSPPEVLTLGDAVAVSPLAADPDDPRVVGYFQVDPGERVRTPYPLDDDPGPPRHRALVTLLGQPQFAPLRALSFGDPAPPPDRRLALTTHLGQLSNQVYRELAADNAADLPLAAPRKQVPLTSRNQVTWEAIQSQQLRNAPLSQTNDAAPVYQQIAAQQAQGPLPGAYAPPPTPTLPQQTEVDYTPMAYLAVGDRLLLQRVVSHADTGSVQGLLLDRDLLVRTWLPAVAARHAAADAAPQIVLDPTACPAPEPLAVQIPGVWLCFAAPAPLPNHLVFQTGALLGLILIVGLGIIVVARAARRADELSAQKTAFVSAVSHELRTPLTTLRMHAELLQGGLVAPASLPTIHDDLVRESVRLARLVENVLAVAQLEEGRRVLDLRPADLAAALREVIASQARHIASKGFAAPLLEIPDRPVIARFDAQALEQIVVNLLDNALKYAADLGDRTLLIALELPPGRALLRVQDRGPGIPEADRERVFQRFIRVQRASSAHTPGTGLGLSLVRDLARAHGGDAHAFARPGGGLDLQVWIPRAP